MIKNTFSINGVIYTAKPFDFNTVCDLEDAGVSLDAIQKKPMGTVRAYFTVCSGGDPVRAGKELQAHMVNGGTFNGIMDAMAKELEVSDFFRALSERQTEETSENQTAETEKD